MRLYSPCHLQGVKEKININVSHVLSHCSPLFHHVVLIISLPLGLFVFPNSAFSYVADPQPEPQRDLSDQLPSGVQVHSRAHRVPEASQIPSGHHLHGEHSRHQGEWHLLCHLHPALRSGR